MNLFDQVIQIRLVRQSLLLLNKILTDWVAGRFFIFWRGDNRRRALLKIRLWCILLLQIRPCDKWVSILLIARLIKLKVFIDIIIMNSFKYSRQILISVDLRRSVPILIVLHYSLIKKFTKYFLAFLIGWSQFLKIHIRRDLWKTGIQWV